MQRVERCTVCDRLGPCVTLALPDSHKQAQVCVSAGDCLRTWHTYANGPDSDAVRRYVAERVLHTNNVLGPCKRCSDVVAANTDHFVMYTGHVKEVMHYQCFVSWATERIRSTRDE